MEKEEIVETIMLQNEKSLFFIDLCKYPNSGSYVSISQKVLGTPKEFSTIKLNPDLLDEFVGILQKYRELLSLESDKIDVSTIDSRHEIIISNYLKGISPEELCKLYDISMEKFKFIMASSNIAFFENNTKPPFKKRYWRKKRS